MRKFLRPPLPVCIEIYTKMVYIILKQAKKRCKRAAARPNNLTERR